MNNLLVFPARWTCVPQSLLLVTLAALLLPVHSAVAQEASHSPGWVVIPVDEYRNLHNRAFPPDREPEPPPVEATLTRVAYDLRINNDFASGRASLTIDVLKDGWVRVPIPTGLLVREARLDGKLVSLVSGSAGGKGGGQLAAVLSRVGRSVLVLDVALPIATNAGEESIALPGSASGVTRASVEIPRQGVDVRIGGGLLSDHSESAASSTWIVYGRGNEPLSFAWRRKTEEHHVELPLRFRGSLTQLFGLGEDSTSLSAEVNLDVVQGSAREVKIEVPSQVTINQVLGASISDWESKDGTLTVSFLEPVEQAARFVITGESRLPRDGQFDIPLLRMLNAERDTGGVAIEVLGAGEIKDVKAQGLDNADASDLGEMVSNRQSPSLVAFRVRPGEASAKRTLHLNIARYDQQAVLMANIEEARYRVLVSKEGKTLVQALYAVRNNQRNFVKVALPPGATLWSASLSGRPVRPGQSPDGSLLLPLEKSRASEDAPEFAVEIFYLMPGTAWNDKGKAKLTLPSLDLPISRTGLVVYYPPLFRVSAESGGSFRATTYAEPICSVLSPTSAVSGPVMGYASAGVGGALIMTAPGVASDAVSPPPKVPFDATKQSGGRKDEAAQAATRTLIDRYNSSSSYGRATGVLPIRVSFPAFGPSIYLVSELTSESQAPSAELSYQQDKKAGGK